MKLSVDFYCSVRIVFHVYKSGLVKTVRDFCELSTEVVWKTINFDLYFCLNVWQEQGWVIYPLLMDAAIIRLPTGVGGGEGPGPESDTKHYLYK